MIRWNDFYSYCWFIQYFISTFARRMKHWYYFSVLVIVYKLSVRKTITLNYYESWRFYRFLFSSFLPINSVYFSMRARASRNRKPRLNIYIIRNACPSMIEICIINIYMPYIMAVYLNTNIYVRELYNVYHRLKYMQYIHTYQAIKILYSVKKQIV